HAVLFGGAGAPGAQTLEQRGIDAGQGLQGRACAGCCRAAAGDATLHAIASTRPATLADLRGISGVGDVKL
ncbi:MAG: HRDC domain-containing protein, partial [Pseudomonadota bacterium]|nr:HRDC domain-containing protein [Pseudomonadota bacterium]